MSNLVNVPKNGSLANTTSNVNFQKLSNWFDDLVHRDVPSVFASNFNHGFSLPKVNIKENLDVYIVEMAVPGLKKSDFKIELDNQVLSVSTEISDENEQKIENFTRKEFNYSSFKRTFNLPESVNDESINANYKDGILSIILPKKEEAKQKPARTISIS